MQILNAFKNYPWLVANKTSLKYGEVTFDPCFMMQSPLR